ncbi:hypothetical protein EDB19DRAFT_1834409 [Suillus lakei]|nr:hypothetical protein EDB19DRAFT_1834409 [Suillus lakei]
MATPTVSTFINAVILRPIVVAINSLVLASLMSYMIAGWLDWRPALWFSNTIVQKITVCTTCDILAVGIDHFRDQGIAIGTCGAAVIQCFALLFYLVHIFLVLNVSLLMIALCPSPPNMAILTCNFYYPRFSGFICVKHDQETGYSSLRSGTPFIIKRVPGMKAIFNGIIRGQSWKSDYNVLPWTIIKTVIWLTVNHICHSTCVTLTEDDKAGVLTIPVLLGSPLKTWIVLTIIQAAVMIAFIGNPYILASSCFAIALVWILGKDSPKECFLLSIHSQSIFIVIVVLLFELMFGF